MIQYNIRCRGRNPILNEHHCLTFDDLREQVEELNREFGGAEWEVIQREVGEWNAVK